MASWLEVSMDAHGGADALCARLEALGFSGFVVEDGEDFHSFLRENTQYWDFVDDALEENFRDLSRVKLWLPDDDSGAARLAELQKLGLSPSSKRVAQADWENSWQDAYQPLEIGQKLVVLPQWIQADGPRIPVVLDPGLLFGTGQHPTTHLCLEAAERLTAPGAKVLDLGCGSGILGIAAMALGAGSVAAADVDPKAPGIVRENAALNGFADDFRVYVGDVTQDGGLRRRLGGGYDLIFANIVADVIIALAPHIPALLSENGRLVTSGIIDGREGDVETALQNAGLAVREHHRREEWHCLVCSK